MDYLEFISRLKELIGIDLSYYKRRQMERRITSLMGYEGYSDFREYLKALASDRRALDKLLNHLTINFSEFFRDTRQWEILKEQILPGLAARSSHLRIWSAGCATGEEPYSLVITLIEAGIQQAAIIATDIDDQALLKARQGSYSLKAVKNVPERLLRRYFRLEGERCLVSDEVKKQVIFKKHDLLKEMPPDRDFDLILCRNVIIYFTEEAKEALYARMLGVLKIGGCFFAGNTEQIFQPERLGLALVTGQFFYRRIR